MMSGVCISIPTGTIKRCMSMISEADFGISIPTGTIKSLNDSPVHREVLNFNSYWYD